MISSILGGALFTSTMVTLIAVMNGVPNWGNAIPNLIILLVWAGYGAYRAFEAPRRG